MAELLKIKTPEFRVSFPYLFQVRPPKPGKEGMYELVMLFPKSNPLTELKEAAKKAVLARWPDPATRPKGLKSPFRDGDEKAELGGFAGCTYINAKTKTRPPVVDQAVRPITDPNLLYAGCYAFAWINAYAYDTDGNRGVSFGLLSIQKSRDGERFGTFSDPTKDYQPIAGASSKPATALDSAKAAGVVAPSPDDDVNFSIP